MRQAVMAAAMLLLAACGSQSGNEQAAANGAQTGESPAAGGAGASVTLQPGQWQSTVEIVRVSAPNMPPGMAPPAMPPVTASYCITPEQAANPNAGMIAGSNAQTGCTTENYSMTNGRIQGTIQCDIQGNVARTTMDGQFTPTSYEMTMVGQQTMGGVTTETETRITAQRTGDCPAG